MTDPRTTPHDDDPREHRGIGKRIMDAVLGDPADQRHDDPAGTRRDDPADTRQVDADRPGGGVGNPACQRGVPPCSLPVGEAGSKISCTFCPESSTLRRKVS